MIIYGLISRGAEHPLNCKFWGLCTSENEAKGGLCEMSLVASVQFSLDKYPHWHWSKNGKMSLRTVFKVFFFSCFAGMEMNLFSVFLQENYVILFTEIDYFSFADHLVFSKKRWLPVTEKFSYQQNYQKYHQKCN